MDWETARRWLEIMAKNVFDPNQPAYIVVLQRVEELEVALRLGAEAYVAALPDASTDAMTDLTIERNALRQEIERLRWIAAAVVQAVDADPDVKVTEIKVYPDGAAHWLQEYARAALRGER